MSDEYKVTKEEDLIIKNQEIPKVEATPEVKQAPNIPPEEIKVKQVVSNYGPDIKDVKKNNVKEFNESEGAKFHGVKAVNKVKYAVIITFAVLFFILLAIQVIWGNHNLSLIAKKDLSPTINNNNQIDVQPANVTANISSPITNNNYIYNNITVNATIVLPNNLSIKVQNLTSS